MFLLSASVSVHAADKDNTQNLPQNFEHVFDGDVAFTMGGLWSRFLVIEEWVNPAPIHPYETGTIVQHNNHVWIALSTPGADDEPGSAAVWQQMTGSGSGSSLTVGTTDPTGGSSGDAYVQVDASNEVQSIWRNNSGTWAEYTIPTAGTSTDDQTAAEVNTNTANFGGNLSNTDTTVQAALDTIDDLTIGVGTTNLGIDNRDADSLDVTSSTGTDAEIPSATTALAGLLASVDKTKLDGIATGAEVNVQADWNEATTTDDAFIQNKPTIPDAPATWALATGATGTAPPERLPGHTIHRESSSQTYDPTNGVIEFTVDGTLRNGDFIVFDAPSNLGSDDSVNLTVNVNNTGNRNLIDREENRINETHLEASAWYIIQRDASSYSVLTNLEDVPTQEQIEDHVGALVNRGTKTGITVTYADNADNAGQINFNVTGGGGGGGSAGEVLVDELSVDWTLEEGPSPAIELARALTDDDELGLLWLDWREWETTDPGEPNRDNGTGFTVSSIRKLTDAAPVSIRKDPNSAGNPIDQTRVVLDANISAAMTFKFPRSTGNGGFSDMRMVYIGDHTTDTNENVDQTETDITVVSSANLVASTDYWMVGATQGCATTYHWEKVTVDSIDDGTTITATRGVDGTGLPDGCQFIAAADIIADNKRSFVFLSGHAGHDNAVITFRLLGSGGGMADLSDNAPHDVVSGAAAAGTSADASRSDHVHSGVPAPATTVVSTTYDDAGTVGSHANYARQDHRHGLNKTDRFDDSAAPENVTTGTSSAGTDDTPARRDHVHGGDTNTQRTLATGTPQAVVTGTGSVGTSTSVAREDHVHGGDRNTQRTLSDSTPSNIAETGSAGSNTEVSREDHVHGGAPQPADSIVTETITATGTVGSSTTEFAREDHRHGINVAGLFDSTDPEDVGTAAPGTATVAARRDHVHGGGTGDITGVTVTAPITGGGTTGDVTIGISGATTTAAGSMSAADKTKLDGLEMQLELIDSHNDVDYNQNDADNLSSRFGGNNAYVADIDAEGTADAEINDMFVFQWRDNPAGVPSDRALGIRINQTGTTLPIRIIDPLTNTLVNKTVADLTRYEFLFLSRQDGVFIQLSTLALNSVMQRILPASPTDDQIARYDSATSSWVAEDLAAAISTFIGDTDTPNDYTNSARHLLRVNGTPDGVEFIPEPANDNTIPHVSRLPTVADDSPVLVFLTHDELDGDREDATLTVGEALGQYCGYSNGDIFQAFGSISKPSPIEMIFGIWDGTDCTIQTVHSANEGFIDDIRSVIFTVAGGTEATCNLGTAFQEYGYETKRILSCTGLEDIATGDVTINFLYEDGATAYWTDGSQVHRAGLYEKTGTPPVYHDLAPPEDAHKTGEGSAACGDTEPPDAAGQICVTSDGRGYFAMPRTELEITPATITVSASGSDLFIPDLYETSDLQNRVGLTDGQFIYIKTSQDFYQFQDPDFEVVSWMQAWQYIISNVGDTAVRQAFLTSVFLGEFASEAEVQRDRDGYTTPLPALLSVTLTGGVVTDIAIDYGGRGYTSAPTITIDPPGGTGTQATATATITDGVVTDITITEGGTEYDAVPDATASEPTGVIDYYFLYSDFGTLIHISEFTNSVHTDIDAGFAWRGPVIIPEEVLDVVDANPTDEIDGALDSILVGSQVYSVIVRRDSTGHLRPPTASDYSNQAVGFDGQWKEVGRRLIPGHSASADDNIRSDGDTTTSGGRTYRYRDEHHGDGNVHNAQNLDYYWDLRSNRFRWCFTTAPPPAACRWSDMHTDSGHFDGVFYQTFNFLGYFESREDALAAATRSGQSAIYARSGGYDFNTFSNLVVALADQYVYDWRDVIPPNPPDPNNETLVDDLSVTFNAADRPSIEVKFSRELLGPDDGRPIIIDYRPNASGGNNRATGGTILAEHVRHLTTLRPVALQKDPPGGRNPIDHTEDLPTGAHQFSPGHVEFPFPLSTGDNDLHWMRLIYIGDHIDDMDGSFGSGATTITVDNPDGIVAGRNYWIVGPVSGGGCTPTYHSEKVMVTDIGTPNADDLTVVRGVDGTGLDNSCAWVSGADIIEDDKRTFILAATADDQDSGDFTFTLLSQGVGGQAAQAGTGSGGGGILKQKHLASSTTAHTINDATWTTIMSQAVTVVDNDRVYLDAVFSIESTANNSQCEMRVLRGTNVVGSVVEGDIGFSGEIETKALRRVDTPGAGAHTYNFQVQDNGAGDCLVNAVGTSSFATVEVLSANP